MEEAPEYVQNMFVTEKRHSFDNKGNNNGDSFMVEDLLDFSNNNDDAVIADDCGVGGGVAAFTDTFTGNSTDSSTLTVIDTSSNSTSGEPTNFAADFSTRNFNEVPFSSDLCIPYDDLAELEWQLSSFTEESFSTEDLQKLQLISGIKARPDDAASHTRQFQPDPNNNNHNSNPIFNSDISVPAKARSKRSRASPCNWTSRLLLLSPTSESSPESSDASVVSEQQQPPQLRPPASVGKKTLKASPKKKENLEGGASGGDGRKCLHCATDKTPQWRTGPMGPKTLCNACGVRYKSGRLVPEYRPAASPTFVLTKHSNSHRKVLELRRQKEMGRGVPNHHQYVHHHHHRQPPQQQHHHNSNMIFEVNGGDYLIHQHVGTDFRQLI